MRNPGQRRTVAVVQEGMKARTLADEEVPKAHEGRDTAGEEIGKVEIKEGTT